MSVPRRVRRRRDPAPAARLLPRIRSAPARADHTDLAAAWRELGPTGAGAIPLRMSRNGVVTVACADAMHAQRVASDGDHLREELSRIAGISVTRIDTVIADHALRLPEFDQPPVPPVSPDALHAAEQVAEGLTAGIDDPELRDVITRAAASSIARAWDANRVG